MYSKDICKVHSSYVLKAQKGQFTGCLCPVLDTKKTRKDKNRLLIDEETAPVVRLIFRVCAERERPDYYPATAGGRKTPLPHMVEPGAGASEHPHQMGKEKPGERAVHVGDFTVIKDILMNPVYTGAIASPKDGVPFESALFGKRCRRTGLWWKGRMNRWLIERVLPLCRRS